MQKNKVHSRDTFPGLSDNKSFFFFFKDTYYHVEMVPNL